MSDTRDGTSNSNSRATSGHHLGSGSSGIAKAESVVFGVLYTMVKDNSSMPHVLRLMLVLVDTIQVMGLAFGANLDWGSEGVRVVLRFASDPFNGFHVNAFFGVYSLVVFALLLSYLNFYIVAREVLSGEVTYLFPVKTLRFLCTSIITVFYMPFLNVLLVFLSCNNGTLRSFPEVQCWSVTAVIPGVLSIIMIVLFVPSAILFRLIFFNPDPLSPDPLARPLSRVEPVWICFKTALVFTFKLSSSTLAQALLLIGVSFAILAYQVYVMSNYKKYANHLIAAAFSINIATGCGMLVAINDSRPVVIYPSLVALIVGFALLGVISSELRWRWLLRTGLAKGELAQEKLAGGDDGKDGVFGEHDISVVIASRTAGHLAGPSETQRLVRVVLQSGSVDEDVAKNLEALFKYAIETHPKNAALVVSYAAFLTHYRRNTHLATVQNRKVSKLKPAFDIRFLSYCSERTIFEENQAISQGEGRLDVLTYLEFQKMQAHAHRYHQETLELMKKFWGSLLSEEPNWDELQVLTGRLTASQDRATSAYQQIIKSFPNNKQIYRSAAAFMADVHYDYDMAAFYEDQAEELEDDGRGEGEGGSKRSGTYASRRNMSEASIVKHRGFREALKSRKSTAVERLSRVSSTSLLLLCALAIVNFVVVYVLLNNYDDMVHIMRLVFKRSFMLQTSLLRQTEMVVGAQHNSTELYAAYQATFTHDLERMSDWHQELYELTYGKFDELDEEWTDPQLEFRSPLENATTFMTNQKDGLVTYVLGSLFVADLPLADFFNHPFALDFVYANGNGDVRTPWQQGLDRNARVVPAKLCNTLERLVYLYSSYTADQINVSVLSQFGLYAFAVFTTVVLGLGFFRPALNKVQQERTDTFGLFLTIPHDIVRKVYDSIKVEDTHKKEGKKSKKAAAASHDALQASKKSHHKFQLFAAFVFIVLLFTVTTIVTSTLLFSTANTPAEMDDSARRSFFAQRAGFLALSLLPIANDMAATRTLGTLEETQQVLRSSVDELVETHLRFLTGGTNTDGWEIKGIGTSDKEQLHLTRKEVCLVNPPPCPSEEEAEFVGLEGILQYYVAQGRMVADMPPTAFENHTEPFAFQEMLRVRPLLIQAIQSSSAIIDTKSRDMSNRGRVNAAVLMSVIILAIGLLFAGLFRPIMARLRTESYRTSALLLMIPPEMILEVETVRNFLETGSLSEAKELRSVISGKKGEKYVVPEDGKEENGPSPSTASLENDNALLVSLARVGEMYVVVDPHSTIMEVSNKLLSTTLFAREELMGESLAFLFHFEPTTSCKASSEEDSLAPGGVRNETAMLRSGVTEGVDMNMKLFTQTHARAVMGAVGSSEPFQKHPPVRLRTKPGAASQKFDLQFESVQVDGKAGVLALFRRTCRCMERCSESSESTEDSSSFEGRAGLRNFISKSAKNSSNTVLNLSVSAGMFPSSPVPYSPSGSAVTMPLLPSPSPGTVSPPLRPSSAKSQKSQQQQGRRPPNLQRRVHTTDNVIALRETAAPVPAATTTAARPLRMQSRRRTADLSLVGRSSGGKTAATMTAAVKPASEGAVPQ